MTADEPPAATGQSPLVPLQRLEALMGQSIDALSAILADKSVPARDRAELALRLLSLGLGADTSAAQAMGAALPLQFVTIPDFLTDEQHAVVVQTALDNRARFEKSTVAGNAQGYRESLVLHAPDYPALETMLRQEIITALPAVLDGLGHAPFPVARLEMQMTAHGDGAFFRVHEDVGTGDAARREITYVYYFQARSPRGFTGGDLRIYQTFAPGPVRHDPAQFRDVTPTDNSITFFDSRLMHEVLPVEVRGGAFEDWRFTVNGWLHR